MQLLLEILRFSSSTFSALLEFTDFGDKELMDILENFILEALNLTKDSISDAKVICFSFYMKLDIKGATYVISFHPNERIWNLILI